MVQIFDTLCVYVYALLCYLVYDYKVVIQDAQLSQRDRAAACVIVFAKSRSLELGDNILRTL